MKIKLKQLKKLSACAEGLLWFRKQKNKEAKHILRKCVSEGYFSWANWYVTRVFTHPQCVQYAIFNAEQCLGNFESVFPKDTRPRQTIEAAKAWLADPTEENRSAAWSAAESAARSAARSAAWSAAESAARSAAWSTAESAARSAAESAARSAAESAAIEYAITILG